jgi:hypothetical protein
MYLMTGRASALAQDVGGVEVVVVDDGSVDATPDRRAAMDDPRQRRRRLPGTADDQRASGPAIRGLSHLPRGSTLRTPASAVSGIGLSATATGCVYFLRSSLPSAVT